MQGSKQRVPAKRGGVKTYLNPEVTKREMLEEHGGDGDEIYDFWPPGSIF